MRMGTDGSGDGVGGGMPADKKLTEFNTLEFGRTRAVHATLVRRYCMSYQDNI